jgi:FkbH-like protein
LQIKALEIIAKILGREVKIEDGISDWDSVEFVQAILSIEDEFGLSLPMDKVIKEGQKAKNVGELLSIFEKRKKCLVLDLDNTLYEGVISEEEIKPYRDFQKEILEINKKGIILAIATKNNPEDIEPAFEHPSMLLKKEHFSAIKASWQPKSESIKQIAKFLNIGLDSVVFLDDNPIEREEVRQNCPEVVVADFPPKDLYEKYFYSWILTDEDLRKTQMYADNAKREENKKNFASLDDFINDLNIELTVQKVDKSTVVRAAQMLQKTNQFNLTTKRFSETQISQMLDDSSILMFIGHVKDKFGDMGFSILSIVKLTSESEAEIDCFLMSCRIMWRKIEFKFLTEIEKILANRGVKTVRATYVPSEKNSPCMDFYAQAGYETAGKYYFIRKL